eukprot:5584265-Pyramimonas_sp.AAC.1
MDCGRSSGCGFNIPMINRTTMGTPRQHTSFAQFLVPRMSFTSLSYVMSSILAPYNRGGGRRGCLGTRLLMAYRAATVSVGCRVSLLRALAAPKLPQHEHLEQRHTTLCIDPSARSG